MKTSEIRELLSRFPKAPVGFFPTPLQRLDRLSDELGAELWIKRDDFTGMGLFEQDSQAPVLHG